VSTDKPIYRGAERLYGRCVILAADSHALLNQNTMVVFEITGPKGDRVASGRAPVENSVAGLSWDIPDGQAGGEYLLTSPAANGFARPCVGSTSATSAPAPEDPDQVHPRRLRPGIPLRHARSQPRRRRHSGECQGQDLGPLDGAEIHASTVSLTAAAIAPRYSSCCKIERGEGSLAFVWRTAASWKPRARQFRFSFRPLTLRSIRKGRPCCRPTCRVYIEGKTLPASR